MQALTKGLGHLSRMLFPKHGEVFEVFPCDLPKPMTYLQTRHHIAHWGEESWRLPTLEELMLMYENKLTICGFDAEQGSGELDQSNWYWSSTALKTYPMFKEAIDFSTGKESWFYLASHTLSCRPVRSIGI